MLEEPFCSQVSRHISFPSWALPRCYLLYFPHLHPTQNVVEVTVGSCGGDIVLSRLSGDSRAHLAPGRPSGRTLPPAAAAWSAARGLEVTVTLSPNPLPHSPTPPPCHTTGMHCPVQALMRPYWSSSMVGTLSERCCGPKMRIEWNVRRWIWWDYSGVMSYCHVTPLWCMCLY